jgi:Serine acetyltransferase
MSNVDKIVNGLVESYGRHQVIVKMNDAAQPSHEIIVQMIEDIRKLVFPGYFDVKHLKSETVKFYVGEILGDVRYNMQKQIDKAYRSTGVCAGRHAAAGTGLNRGAGTNGSDPRLCEYCEAARFRGLTDEQYASMAEEATEKFLERIEAVHESLETDVEAAFDGDPAACSTDEVIYSYPGLYAIMVNRIAHELYALGVPLIPRIMSEHAHSLTGIDIHPGAKIGDFFFIDHGTGIVIGETTVIGHHVRLYHNVTLGAVTTRGGQLLHGTKRHPTIGNYITIYEGASVLGGETTIGDGCTIGGGAFITASVPPGTKVTK